LIECLDRSLDHQKTEAGGRESHPDTNPTKRPVAILENAAGS
jgi:hypothetical protein